MEKFPEKQNIVMAHINLEEVKNSATFGSASTPSSPITFQKSSSVKYNCLCSPTTHAGSFRCRYHRNPGMARSSVSVGGKLNELGSVSSNLSDMESKPPRICDQLHAH
ncbi:hypothetical protein CsSME_00018761 [Camellia sinensis var. sinensis]